jgi:hypothetical protein
MSIPSLPTHHASSQYQAQAIQSSAPATGIAPTGGAHQHHGPGSAAATPASAATTANSIASAVGTLIGSIINTVA